jgi:uncharacterized protein (TIGR01777 family)
MKVLITGATGLIGNEIVALCHQRKLEVNFLTTSKDKLIQKENLKGYYWNPATAKIDLECFQGVSAIINLAGASISKRWTKSYKKEILSSRLDSLRTLYGALKKIDGSQIKSFVSASAVGIYPNSLTSLYDEDENKVDDSFLGAVVEAWEKEVDLFAEFGFTVAKIRIGLVMSAKGGALPEMSKPIKYGLGAAFGSGEQWQSWIHISDLAHIFIFVIENELQGIYNGVGPNPVTNSKLVREIAKVLDRPLILPNIPKFAMKALLGEMSYILFASQRVSSKKIEEEGFIFRYRNICLALQEIYQVQPEEEPIEPPYTQEYTSLK